MAPDLSAASGDAVDMKFLDPAECYYVYGQPPPSPQGHSGYWADPRVWDIINQVAAADGRRPGNGAGTWPGTSGISPELVQELVQVPDPSPAELAIKLDRGGEPVHEVSDRGRDQAYDQARGWDEGDSAD